MITEAKNKARNEPPISVALPLAGAAFDTSASVIGQYHMKPTPIPNQPSSGHNTETCPPGAASEPTTSRTPDAPVIAAPIAILVMAAGSAFRRACQAHKPIRKGAMTMLAKLSTELNQLAGTGPSGEARSSCWSTQTTPMFQIIV